MANGVFFPITECDVVTPAINPEKLQGAFWIVDHVIFLLFFLYSRPATALQPVTDQSRRLIGFVRLWGGTAPLTGAPQMSLLQTACICWQENYATDPSLACKSNALPSDCRTPLAVVVPPDRGGERTVLDGPQRRTEQQRLEGKTDGSATAVWHRFGMPPRRRRRSIRSA